MTKLFHFSLKLFHIIWGLLKTVLLWYVFSYIGLIIVFTYMKLQLDINIFQESLKLSLTLFASFIIFFAITIERYPQADENYAFALEVYCEQLKEISDEF